jgi:hypothetical protein
MAEFINLTILKEQVKGMWDRLVASKSNAAAESRFPKNISNGSLSFLYSQVN